MFTIFNFVNLETLSKENKTKKDYAVLTGQIVGSIALNGAVGVGIFVTAGILKDTILKTVEVIVDTTTSS